MGASRNVKEVQRVFQGSFKGVSRQFQRHFKAVPRVFKESVNCVSRQFQRKSFKVFQECFNEVLFCNFVLPWISSQKEGLFHFGVIFLLEVSCWSFL